MITSQCGDVEFAFDRPYRNRLGLRLAELAKRNEIACRRASGFLREFALRRGKRVFAGFIEAFGNRPGAFVLLLPERSARMHEQHFDRAALAAIHQNARAPLWHARSLGLAYVKIWNGGEKSALVGAEGGLQQPYLRPHGIDDRRARRRRPLAATVDELIEARH